MFHFTEYDSQVYDSLNTPLPVNDITAVDVENSEFFVWVGTNHGICRGEVSGSSWTCFNTTNSSLPSDSITSILAFSQDSVWIGTRQGLVLYKSANDTFESFTSSNSLLPGNKIQCLERRYFIPYSYHPEPLYVGTDSGFVIINGNNWQVYTVANSPLTSNDIRSLSINDYYGDLSLWIATYGGGIINLQNSNWSFYNTSNQLIKTDSLEFIEYINTVMGFIGVEVTGSEIDSMYLRIDYDTDNFATIEPGISHPIAATSINRGNGPWLWVATANEIYRGDFTQGISNVSSETPKWKANINGKKLFLSEVPPSNEELDLSIYDMAGKLFFEKQLITHSSSSRIFDIPDLSKGTYLVQLLQSGKTETLKVIKAN